MAWQFDPDASTAGDQEPTLNIAARRSRGDESTSELEVDDLVSVENTDIADVSDE
jgi:hypothetical protein